MFLKPFASRKHIRKYTIEKMYKANRNENHFYRFQVLGDSVLGTQVAIQYMVRLNKHQKKKKHFVQFEHFFDFIYLMVSQCRFFFFTHVFHHRQQQQQQ